MNQLVNSIPNDVPLRTSYVERQQSTTTETAQDVSVKLNSSATKRVHFTDAKEKYQPCSDCSSGDQTLSGESFTFGPDQDDLSGESMSGRLGDRVLPGESRNSYTNQMATVHVPSARAMTRSLSPGRMCRRLPPTPTSRRLRFIPH